MGGERNDENYTGKVSNIIIGSKYGASLLENQIMLLGFFSIQQGKCQETKDAIIVKFTAAEIKKLTNSNSGTIYEQLDNIAKVVTSRVIGYSDPVSKKFDYINVINRITYENHELTMKFNNDLKELIKEVNINYTLLEKAIMMSFKSVYSFRLYELLKSRCYSKDKSKPQQHFVIRYNLAELKFELGVADANASDAVRKILRGHEKPDYDKALELVPEELRKYDRWSNFEKRILFTAENEINSKDIGMHIEHTAIKGKLGGKTIGIEFSVSIVQKKLVNIDNPEPVVVDEASAEEMFAIKAEVFIALRDKGVTLTEIESICKEANYEREKIFKAIEVLNAKKNGVDNIVGFLIQACRDNYEVPKSQPAEKDFANFTQRKYDKDFYTSLEIKMAKVEV